MMKICRLSLVLKRFLKKLYLSWRGGSVTPPPLSRSKWRPWLYPLELDLQLISCHSKAPHTYFTWQIIAYVLNLATKLLQGSAMILWSDLLNKGSTQVTCATQSHMILFLSNRDIDAHMSHCGSAIMFSRNLR